MAKHIEATDGLVLERLNGCRWRVPRQGRMRVDGLIFASDALIEDIRDTEAVRQVANVACLPGVVGRSIGMPDIHWGFGFPIGGVAAFDPAQGGVVSPGGVGYDINCGVRLLRTPLHAEDLGGHLPALMDRLFQRIPAGVGRGYGDRLLRNRDMRRLLREGAEWAVEVGLGEPADLARIEDGGRLPGADPEAVSDRAIQRGRDQVGTVGSGNHFIEIGCVDAVYDEPAALRLGLEAGTLTVLIHSGSRGLGHQVCDDFLVTMERITGRNSIELPDRQLACAPLSCSAARDYLGAMQAAANFAYVNRQAMTQQVRQVFAEVLGETAHLKLVYDVSHNIAKFERHRIDGEERELCVHRKGATRAFPPGHPELPEDLRGLGQPVLLPGDMTRYSYVLLGTQGAYAETFGSCAHGAGRRLSRRQAKRAAKGRDLDAELAAAGIEVRASSRDTVAEELAEAYKDVADVVDVVAHAGIGRRVARLRPLGVLKG
ncbi:MULTISPECIES: RtcB family protein [unclassified Halorhodospira]|uniref:RtcB family protein n=1 Tax=unclassified Halorhodospira TaxID=2626748 RepID=UPI001EE7D1F6|nr:MULTISPECIES: RtcB family protein [unclassified Halorhodospira]MCG5540847.1 RtcB family protein [Halorhodospira sp. M39old]MCG5546087.1 RtcB family protein [Halorhodospira sp. M38]